MEEKLHQINFHRFAFFPLRASIKVAWCRKKNPAHHPRPPPSSPIKVNKKTIQASAAGADGADAEQMRCR